MKIVVTHASPDWDAITSVWLIKRFLPDWSEAEVKFVPAGSRIKNFDIDNPSQEVIEKIGDDEVMHVDTGLGPLDHHQTSSESECGASRTWDYVKATSEKFKVQSAESNRIKTQESAIDRIVRIVVAIDHFKELYWENSSADYHEFSLLGLLEGLKLMKPDADAYYMQFGIESLDAMLHNFENRIWAEQEIEKGVKFTVGSGVFKGKGKGLPAGRQGIGFETINDSVLKLAQKMGFAVVVRKDPRKGYVRIKARPVDRDMEVETKGVDDVIARESKQSQDGDRRAMARDDKVRDTDLTLAYEALKKMDPEATWYLHVSKKMLLNGTTKNPKMVPTKLSLGMIIEVLKSI